jgi:hypothetical protein
MKFKVTGCVRAKDANNQEKPANQYGSYYWYIQCESDGKIYTGELSAKVEPAIGSEFEGTFDPNKHTNDPFKRGYFKKEQQGMGGKGGSFVPPDYKKLAFPHVFASILGTLKLDPMTPEQEVREVARLTNIALKLMEV